jgi:aminopeptidase-like protein/aminoglycoside N3'-acetyltransferase
MPVQESVITKKHVLQGLAASGLRAGDTVLLQVSLRNLGPMDPAVSVLELSDELLSAVLQLIGSEGTLLVPAFTFSFDRLEEFDPGGSPAVSGPWSETAEFPELVRRCPNAVRSCDPLYSISGIGRLAGQLLSKLPNTSFGRDSVFERLLRSEAKLCLIGVDLQDAVLVDFVEESAFVQWRYKKLFTGIIRQNGATRKLGWIASVRNKAFRDEVTEIRARVVAHAEAEVRSSPPGSGRILVANIRGFCEVLQSRMVLEAAKADLTKPQDRAGKMSVHLPPSATMGQTITALWRLPRDIVSDGYDAALRALATQVPMQIYEYPTGTECWTWLVPEKWTCRDARLETLDGDVLFSYRDNPLHAVSYSLAIDEVVTREELFRHLHTHPRLDDAIPFVFKYYERDWGLCCSKKLKDTLTDERYRVVIESEFGFGSLKVGECVARGSSDQTFVLCAHLCHPAMVNDDLTGVVVGMEVMQELLKRSDLRFTYRFLIVPETIGSVAYLSHHQHLVPHMVGGLFLEMLGLDNPHALQLSFQGDTEIDRCFSRVLTESSPDSWIGAFRTVVGNDERQFNAPGVRVPMLSLSRVTRGKSNGWPYYPEYHSSHDTPELASESRLAKSRDLVLRMIDALETNEVPVNLFQGEVFCSRFGLHIDPYANPEGNHALFDILFLVDGTRSVAEIARLCGVSVTSVRSVLEELRVCGLIAYAPLPRS